MNGDGDDSTNERAGEDPVEPGGGEVGANDRSRERGDPSNPRSDESGEASRHDFWAESVAETIIARNPDSPIIIKGGISPSGVPHLGNMNEVMRGYYVAEALRNRGRETRQIFTADDRDPLRSIPNTLADLDGNLVGLDEVDAAALGRNLGVPYTGVPDPFGCCDSYGDHFATLIERGAEQLGVAVEVISTTELYESGEFEAVTRDILSRRDLARDVLANYQDKVTDQYVPFNPICGECGQITETIHSVDVAAGTLQYECTGLTAGEESIEGCGYRGNATLTEGKLPWRFEWPAQWQILDVDHEPFGKDHAEGSWPSGKEIARRVLANEPPVPLVYEWFTLNGKPFSSSGGNVILVGDVLELIEPEVLRYFFTKDPRKARDFDIEQLDGLVGEFDRLERAFFDDGQSGDVTTEWAKRVYPAIIRPTIAAIATTAGKIELTSDGPWSRPVTDSTERERCNQILDDRFLRRERLPYTFAAVLGMAADTTIRTDIARKEGHLSASAPQWAVEYALARVELASEWATRTDNEFNYELKLAAPPQIDFDEKMEAALEDLAAFVAEGHDGEAIQSEIYDTARRHDIDISDFFAAGYLLFFGKDEGPQLGHFLAKLDRSFVVRRLRREG